MHLFSIKVHWSKRSESSRAFWESSGCSPMSCFLRRVWIVGSAKRSRLHRCHRQGGQPIADSAWWGISCFKVNLTWSISRKWWEHSLIASSGGGSGRSLGSRSFLASRSHRSCASSARKAWQVRIKTLASLFFNAVIVGPLNVQYQIPENVRTFCLYWYYNEHENIRKWHRRVYTSVWK